MISEERLLDLWADGSGRPITLGRKRVLDFARAVEAEARREALEEAARQIEWNGGSKWSAAAIRALKEGK